MSIYENISKETNYGRAIHDLKAKVDGGGGDDGPSEITSAQITDATATGRNLLTASSQQAARTAIGAGTSNLELGTGASQAMPGNTPIPAAANWNTLPGKPEFIAAGADAGAARTAIGAGTSNLTIGTTGSTAAAGNHSHGAATESQSGFMTGAMVGKLNGIETGANNYTLPAAAASTRGGVLQGAAVADATDETDSAAQLNALLAALRAAGVIAE